MIIFIINHNTIDICPARQTGGVGKASGIPCPEKPWRNRPTFDGEMTVA